MTSLLGAEVSALPLPREGHRRVRGVVLDVRGSIVLLAMPHGRWVALDSVRVISRPSGLAKK